MSELPEPITLDTERLGSKGEEVLNVLKSMIVGQDEAQTRTALGS